MKDYVNQENYSSLNINIDKISIEDLEKDIQHYRGLYIYNQDTHNQIIYTLKKIQDMQKNRQNYLFCVIPLDPYFLFKIWYYKRYSFLKQKNFLFLPNGKGLKATLKGFGKPLKHYVSLKLYLINIIRLLKINEEIIIFIANNNDHLARLSRNFRKAYPNQKILYKHYKKNSIENQNNLIQLIIKVEPKIVFLSLGRKQEINWLKKNYTKFQKHTVIITLNGSLKFLLGFSSEAPDVFAKNNLSWFWKIFINPFVWYRFIFIFFLFIQSIFRMFRKLGSFRKNNIKSNNE